MGLTTYRVKAQLLCGETREKSLLASSPEQAVHEIAKSFDKPGRLIAEVRTHGESERLLIAMEI